MSSWPRHLPSVLRGLNRTRSDPRGASPHELMFGAKPHLAVARRHGIDPNAGIEQPVPSDPAQQPQFAIDLAQRVDDLAAAASEGRRRVQLANYTYHQKHGVAQDITPGAFVFIANTGDTQETSVENKQRQGGPYKVISVDALNRRATLQLPGTGNNLPTPISLNRLYRVNDASLNPLAPSFEPGTLHFSGPDDMRLLLPSDRAVANKQLAKQAQAAEREEAARRAAETEKVRREAFARQLEEQAAARRLADQERQSAAARQRGLRQLDQATIAIPPGSKTIGRLKGAAGTLLMLTSDPKKPEDKTKWFSINRDHRRFNEFEQQLTIQRRQQHSVRRPASAGKLHRKLFSTRSQNSRR